MLQSAELLEFLGFFERGGAPFDELEEEVALVAVDAQVPEKGWVSIARVSHVGDKAAGKIERLSVDAGDDFHLIRIGGLFGGSEWSGRGDHRDALIFLQSCDQFVDELGIREGFVTLDIDDPADAFQAGGDFGRAVGAAGVVGFGQGNFRAESKCGLGDAHVVGGDDDLIGIARAETAFPDVLDEGLACYLGEGLAGKTGGGPAGGDDNGGFQGVATGLGNAEAGA